MVVGFAASALATPRSDQGPENAQTLKDAIGKYCLIGAAVNAW